MWNIIKYMFYCLGILISAAFGYNPENLTWKTGLIGVGTLILLLLITALLFYLVLVLINHFSVDKNK